MHTGKIPFTLTLVLAAGAYVVLGKISLWSAIAPGNASAVWPAAGVAVALCLIHGYRLWPAIFIGAAIVTGTTGVTPEVALTIGAGNTLGTLATVWLLKRHTSISDRFVTSVDVFKLAGFALAGSFIAASIGATALLLGGHVPEDIYFQNWLTWFMGDMSGMIIVAPAIISWRTQRMYAWSKQKLAELTLFVVSFALCGLFVFSLAAIPLLFLFLPLLTWLAFRFCQREVAKANVALAVIVVGGTLGGAGPMTGLPFHSTLLVLQVFVSVAGITALALAVTIDERSRATHDLKKMQDHLGLLVDQRTAQLNNVVEALESDIVQREMIQQELRAKEKQLEEAQFLAHLGSWEWDAIADHLIMSKEMMRIYGVPPEERESLNYQKYLHYIPAEESHLVDAVVQSALTTKEPFSYEHSVVRPDGMRRHLRCRGTTETDETGKPVRLYGTAHDITEEKALAIQLREAEELYRKLVELSPDAIYLLHQGRYTFSNGAGLKLVGAAHAGQLVGQPFLNYICRSTRKTVMEMLQQLAEREQSVSVETKIERIDGTNIDIELAAAPFFIQGRQDTLLVARNISERKKSEQQIYHLAHHDPLTGLSNRILFKERLEHAMSYSHRTGRPLAVLFIDLDRFKSINDTAGHGAGDQVLRACAHRLLACLRDSDTVARAGGDEFLILIESASDPLHVPSVAQKILAALGRPFNAVGKEFSIGASIGISTYPADGTDVETLIQHADIAMYRAKTEGRGDFRYYSASMAEQSRQRYAMETALRHALERDEMELYFQPKINLKTGCISGAEALIRWNHPDDGLLLPYRFIPLAEDMGMIAELGMWCLRDVCAHCRDWQAQGLQETRIAVNLAYSQFADGHFFAKIEQLLHDYDLRPERLELEITETMVMENAERLMSTLQQLKRLGVHLSVDDFGTGYSSLAYLKRLPVDSVKVDQSFIRDLPGDTEDVAITHAVLALVHSLKRSVVAEGVETWEQLDFLVRNGCDEGQGFYFSKPLPDKEFRQFLAEAKCFAV